MLKQYSCIVRLKASKLCFEIKALLFVCLVVHRRQARVFVFEIMMCCSIVGFEASIDTRLTVNNIKILFTNNRFEGIDLEFKDLMKSASYRPTVVTFCSQVCTGFHWSINIFIAWLGGFECFID